MTKTIKCPIYNKPESVKRCIHCIHSIGNTEEEVECKFIETEGAKTEQTFENELYHLLQQKANDQGFMMQSFAEYQKYVQKCLDRLRMVW